MTLKGRSIVRKTFLQKKLTENIAKSKELWQVLQSLGLRNRETSPSSIFFKNKNAVSFDSLAVVETFKKRYSSPAKNLV